jgi:putative ABC transport system substrate-binding protein
VGQGIVESLARPGGNATGFSIFELSVLGKMLEMLKQIAPNIQRVGLVSGVENQSTPFYLHSHETIAGSLKLLPLAASVQNSSTDIESVIGPLAREPDSGMLLPPDIRTNFRRELIIRLAAEHRIPAVYAYRSFVGAGGLVSYGVEQADLYRRYRRAATYVDRVLRGARPADLPVQAPVKFEFAINMRTATALGLTVPPSLLADEVIE